MRPHSKIAALGLASVLAVAATTGAVAHGTGPGHTQKAYPPMAGCPYHGMGPGMMGQGMGPGMMGHGMMGPGMMGQGMGPGMTGPGMMGQGMGPGMMGRGMAPGMMDNETGSGPMDPGPMGPGMMGRGMMGPGMMGQGMGPGMMGRGMEPGAMQVLPQDLTPEQVRHMFEHRLGMHGNPNVKVGEVSEVDEDTITVDIVTQDGSLVQRFAVNRHTGAAQPAQ